MQPQQNSSLTIRETDLSDEYKDQSEKLGITTLSDFINYDVARLRSQPGYSQLWYNEMLRQLKKLNLLDDYQGTAKN